MSRLSVFMFPISPDYSGAASALFDLGGITVMHDASGCTGNYTGYDEPRWLGSRSATFCSGLRRMDAVLGNDDKYIRRTIEAARDLSPTIICLLGSPVPVLIGTDLKGMAREIEEETGIPSFGFNTSGQGYYDKGASDVFLALTRRFCKKPSVKEGGSGPVRVNLLGMLPIDFGTTGNLEAIPAFFRQQGFEINANYASGLTVEQIRHAADADWNLVLSRCGLALAKQMQKQYGIPYFCEVPVGDGTLWLNRWKAATEAGSGDAIPSSMQESPASEKGILIIHEQVFANSLRDSLHALCPEVPVTVGSQISLEPELARPGDLDLNLEKNLFEAINSGRYGAVIGDPELYRVLRRDDVHLIHLPHVAVSSKLHWDKIPLYTGEQIPALLQDALSAVKTESKG